MTLGEHARHLLAQLGHIQHAAEEARGAIADIERQLASQETGTSSSSGAGDANHWIPGILEALERIERECADAQYSARELRDGLPGQDELQPRLL
jgi:DNA-binding transcriptional LysR family regulator